MLKLFAKKYLNYLSKGRRKKSIKETAQFDYFKISKNLDENLSNMKKLFGESGDIKYHSFSFGKRSFEKCALIYIDGMADGFKLTEDIIKPLMFAGEDGKLPDGANVEYLMKNVLYSGDIALTGDTKKLVDGCTAGDTVLLLEGDNKGLIISTKGFETRSISEPQTESVVRGPREGFTENFRTNTALLRRKIKNPNFVMETLKKGEKTNTDVCIAYIKGVAKQSVIEMVRQRIDALEIDSVMDIGYIEEYIEDNPLSIFSTVGYTEKPDVVAAKLLEGRVAILSDGSPFAITVPFVFIENFHTSEDYYIRPIAATALRLLRFVTFFLSIFTVPIYVAFTIFHQQLIPTTLLFSIAGAREGTPFPAVIEALILIVSFELLREAGLRLPRHIGQAISIVGALIMGEAAVNAGIVGAPLVIMVAISAVATFATPEIAEVIGMLRLIMLILAATLGGFGIALGFLGLLIHLATLESFGTEYFTLLDFSDNSKDEFVRMPLWLMEKRPKGIVGKDKTRVKTFLPPKPYPALDEEVEENEKD